MDVSAVVVGKNVRKLLNLLFLVFVLPVPVQAQDGLSLESLAAILESQYDAIDSLHYEYTQTGKLLEPDIKQYANPAHIFPDIPAYQFRNHIMWVTDAKIRYDVKHGVSEDNIAFHSRKSWNDERRFISSVLDHSGTISSGFDHGELHGVDPFTNTGFLLTRVTGYFDRSKIDMASVKGLCPLARIQREFDKREEGLENPYLIVDDETVNGKRYVVLKEHYPDHKNPRWAYYFDPEKSYAMVRMVRWADHGIGDAKTSDVKVELQEVNGIFVPRRVDITYYGAYFSLLYNKLPKTSELYAMPVKVWSLTMEHVEVNEAIDPDTFEAASIFDDGMWVLDIDADISFKWGQVGIEETLEELTQELKSLAPEGQLAEEKEKSKSLTPMEPREVSGVADKEEMGGIQEGLKKWYLVLLIVPMLALGLVIVLRRLHRRRLNSSAGGTACLLLMLTFTSLWNNAYAESALVFEDETVSVDRLTAGKKSANAVVFNFVNKADRPVIIEKVTPTCGCNAASLAKYRYLPDESGKIEVTFVKAITDMVGPLKKQVFVLTSLEDSQDKYVHSLFISGVLIGFVIKPDTLGFGDIYQKVTAKSVRTFRVIWLGEKESKPTSVDFLTEMFDIHLLETREKEVTISGQKWLSSERRYAARPILDNLAYGSSCGEFDIAVMCANSEVVRRTLRFKYNRRYPIYAKRTRIAFFRTGNPSEYKNVIAPVMNTTKEKFTVALSYDSTLLKAYYDTKHQAVRLAVADKVHQLGQKRIKVTKLEITFTTESGKKYFDSIIVHILY